MALPSRQLLQLQVGGNKLGNASGLRLPIPVLLSSMLCIALKNPAYGIDTNSTHLAVGVPPVLVLHDEAQFRQVLATELLQLDELVVSVAATCAAVVAPIRRQTRDEPWRTQDMQDARSQGIQKVALTAYAEVGARVNI